MSGFYRLEQLPAQTGSKNGDVFQILEPNICARTKYMVMFFQALTKYTSVHALEFVPRDNRLQRFMYLTMIQCTFLVEVALQKTIFSS